VLVDRKAISHFFATVSGVILSQYCGDQLSSVAKLAEAADPLYFVTFADFTSKIIYFTFGVSLCVLRVSGNYIYAMKISRISDKKTFSRLTVWGNALSSMRVAK
jgi:ABC-type enterochelin transport system permease subunit